jgi:hypothetical protein
MLLSSPVARYQLLDLPVDEVVLSDKLAMLVEAMKQTHCI